MTDYVDAGTVMLVAQWLLFLLMAAAALAGYTSQGAPSDERAMRPDPAVPTTSPRRSPRIARRKTAKSE